MGQDSPHALGCEISAAAQPWCLALCLLPKTALLSAGWAGWSSKKGWSCVAAVLGWDAKQMRRERDSFVCSQSLDSLGVLGSGVDECHLFQLPSLYHWLRRGNSSASLSVTCNPATSFGSFRSHLPAKNENGRGLISWPILQNGMAVRLLSILSVIQVNL